MGWLRPDSRDLSRVIGFEGIDNFRDLGGLPTRDGRLTRPGVLFRSARWSAASSGDLARLAGLGIRTVVDLREPALQASEPDRLPPGASPRPLPMTNRVVEDFKTTYQSVLAGGPGDTLGRSLHLVLYRAFAEDMLGHARELVRALCDWDALPLAVHCTAGKDRTGFLCALVLTALGVRPAAVSRDYMLTNWCRRPFVLQATARCRRPRLARVFLETRREYLAAAFAAARLSRGSFAAYLEAAGLTAPVVAQLRATLLAPAASRTPSS